MQTYQKKNFILTHASTMVRIFVSYHEYSYHTMVRKKNTSNNSYIKINLNKPLLYHIP